MSSYLIISGPQEPFSQIKEFLSNAYREIVILVPYIRADVLEQILPEQESSVSIVTSWKVNDILFGSSDLNLYKLAKEKSIHLFLNNRIHLKAYICDWNRIITGSANLTQKGIGTNSHYNYELNSQINSIDIRTHTYLKTILAEATLVTDEIYFEFEKAVKKQPPIPKVNEFDFKKFKDKLDDFLISSLPMSKDIDALFAIYSYNSDDSIDKESVECAIHDIVLYNLRTGLDKNAFKDHLSTQFFKSHFINNLLEFIGEEGKYFGRVKEWIQQNCHDVPVPSRRDITGNIQVLFKWIVELSGGQYSADRPNYSQRIYRVNR